MFEIIEVFSSLLHHKKVGISIWRNETCLLQTVIVSFYGGSKGFLTTYVHGRIIKQKNFMLLVTETNHGLAYDRVVKVSFETFYDVIFVAMVTKTLLKHTPQKSVF